MDKIVKSIDAIWAIIVILGITFENFFAKSLTPGEFYIALILWYYVVRQLTRIDKELTKETKSLE